MIIVNSIEEIREARLGLSGKIGFVPTMGYLHEGHLSLVKEAQKNCDHVIVSIFVNPTQFGPNEDFARYPRDLEKDTTLLKDLKVDIVWIPDNEIMYPKGFQTWVSVDEMTRKLEGEIRPSHFKGVTTVVAKLFNAVQPDMAFFGQKDAQQARVIQRMVSDLNFPIQIVVCPIIREPDGLALSSRNIYLNPKERLAAVVLFNSLQEAKNRFNGGERDVKRIIQAMQMIFDQEPLSRVQYVACVDPNSFNDLDVIENRALFLLAVYIGKVRLIDNMLLRN